MRIHTNSWHYRFITWYKGGDFPNVGSFCAYSRQLLWSMTVTAFWVSVATTIAAGVLYILEQFVYVWVKFGFDQTFASDPKSQFIHPAAASGFLLLCIIILMMIMTSVGVGLSLFKEYLRARKHHRLFDDPQNVPEDTNIVLNFWHMIHDKVCPLIEVVHDETAD